MCISSSEPGMRIGTDYQAVIPDLEEGTLLHVLMSYCTYVLYVYKDTYTVCTIQLLSNKYTCYTYV